MFYQQLVHLRLPESLRELGSKCGTRGGECRLVEECGQGFTDNAASCGSNDLTCCVFTRKRKMIRSFHISQMLSSQDYKCVDLFRSHNCQIPRLQMRESGQNLQILRSRDCNCLDCLRSHKYQVIKYQMLGSCLIIQL